MSEMMGPRAALSELFTKRLACPDEGPSHTCQACPLGRRTDARPPLCGPSIAIALPPPRISAKNTGENVRRM